MLEALETLENPLMRDIGPVGERELPQYDADLELPADFEIVSADNHWEITEDIFYDNFPEHLKDRAPRVWFEGYWRIGNRGVKEAVSIHENMEKTFRRGLIHDAWSHDVRRKHLAAEGMGKEIVFPQSLLGYSDPDPEVRETMFRVYNEYLAKQCQMNPDFNPMPLFSNWWNPDRVQAAMDQILELGFKGIMVPISPRDAEHKEISYADPRMDPFWTVVSKSGLPVCFHVGENPNLEGRGTLATSALIAFAPYRKPISQMVFGGVFDRYPSLQVVFAEGGISWVLPWMQDAEALYDTYGSLLDPVAHRPSYYWHNNCYATFQSDDLGLSHLDILGADRVMWGADYPHSEGTFGFSRLQMQAIVDKVGKDDAKLILGGNAKRVFKV